LCIAP